MATRDDPVPGQLEDTKTFVRALGLSRSSLRRRMANDPDFPRPCRAEPGAKLQWVVAERIEYVRRLAERRDAARVRHETESRPAA